MERALRAGACERGDRVAVMPATHLYMMSGSTDAVLVTTLPVLPPMDLRMDVAWMPTAKIAIVQSTRSGSRGIIALPGRSRC